jgi:Tfp pilus assembly protein PilF
VPNFHADLGSFRSGRIDVRFFAFCFLAPVLWFLFWPSESLAAEGKLSEWERAGRGNESTFSEFKAGVDKFLKGLQPKPAVKDAPDPLNLDTPSRPSAELHVVMARLAEQQGNQLEAENRYRKALELDPGQVSALVGYARLRERQGRHEQALGLYQRAANVAPDDASVHNDYGLCLAHQRMWKGSLAALEKAIRLDPSNVRYRNNISTVLVELGHLNQAHTHLVAAHGEAVANYNLGYLMHKKGYRRAAIAYFTRALDKDAGLESARRWLEHLAFQSDSEARQNRFAGRGSPGALARTEGTADHGSEPARAPRASRSAAPHYAPVAPTRPASPSQQYRLPPVETKLHPVLSSGNVCIRGPRISRQTNAPHVTLRPASTPVASTPAHGRLPTPAAREVMPYGER